MADRCCVYMHEMDDVHRWLPSEVLRDIGIADADERRRLAIVEDRPRQAQRPLFSCHHRPQVTGGDGGEMLRDHHALAGAGRPRVAATPPLHLRLVGNSRLPLPAPAAPWHVMTGGPRNTMVLRPAPPPAMNHPHPLLRGGAVTGAAPPVTTRRSSGTGFFLPRTTAADPRHANHHMTAAAARPPYYQCSTEAVSGTKAPARQRGSGCGDDHGEEAARAHASNGGKHAAARRCSSGNHQPVPRARSTTGMDSLGHGHDALMHQPAVITHYNYMHGHLCAPYHWC